MCDPLKNLSAQLVQKYGIALIGFVFAAYIYADFRDYMRENLTVMQEVSKTTAVHTEAIRSLTQSVEWLTRKQQEPKQ